MAMILDAFAGRYVNKLSKFIEGGVSKVLGAEDEFKKLHRRMERIRGFLESAERKRHTDRIINMWVTELKDIMYDADDIIDLCMIEDRKLLEDHIFESVVRHPLSFFSYPNLYKFQHKISSKIKELDGRLKEIEEDRSKLSTLEYTRKDVPVSGVNHRQTFPMEVKSDIVGTQIEEATQSLVESSIKEDNKKYRILGIVGMGGIGKTTLASNIYHDKRIRDNFPIRVWVCVSQEFSEIQLLQQIIRCAGGNYGEAETKAELIPLLCSMLLKRFFIVLDDLWMTDVWEHLLQYPIKSAAASGRILITTRNMTIARNIGAEIHDVRKMDVDNGWVLLRKNVFGDDEEEEEISGLKEIGFQIVKKCDGLPLAIKTIAGVLRSMDRSIIEWNKVLESDAWSMSQLHEALPGALFLSYENLPSHLKQCFLYCSLFPEDSIMNCTDLINYWVAEGFVQTAQGDRLMEDLAEDYYKELIQRNLLERNLLQGGCDDDIYYTMHDLLRSLALFLIRDESIFLGDNQSWNINSLTKIRRLSMVNWGERVEVPYAIKQQECLRTLLVWRSYNAKMVENDLFERLRFLRVMDLRNTQLENLPDSIGNLLHLRYLDLERTSISNLPESIGRLINLQILKLSRCSSLPTLPKAITKLCNLRRLDVSYTPLSYVPRGIGKLKHLNHLEGFVVGHDEGCGLGELRSLFHLRFLEINRLDMAQPVGAPVLSNSHFLSTLILNFRVHYDHWELFYGHQEEAIATQRIDVIYNELSPQSTHLQRLEIRGFFGTGFPSWMMSPSLGASFPNLTSIILHGCKLCLQLPPLGLLPQLKSLTIKEADAIKTIGPEFLGPRASSAVTAFPKLEVLEFEYVPNCEEWSFGMVEGIGEERRGAPKLLPRLRALHLSSCPKLRALPEGLRHATSLQELFIHDSSNLKEIDNLPFLTNKLLIMESGLERVSNLPSLKSLEIRFCPRLEHVENLVKLQCLEVWLSPPTETFTTDVDGETERLPQWLLELLGQHQNALVALKHLKMFVLICGLPLFKTFLKDGPNWSIIQRIPQVWIRDYPGNSYIKYTKDPPSFEANMVESEESMDG